MIQSKIGLKKNPGPSRYGARIPLLTWNTWPHAPPPEPAVSLSLSLSLRRTNLAEFFFGISRLFRNGGRRRKRRRRGKFQNLNFFVSSFCEYMAVRNETHKHTHTHTHSLTDNFYMYILIYTYIHTNP